VRKYLKRPSKQTLWQFVLYNFGGLVFFASGYGVFALLYGVLGWHWFFAKAVADLVGWSLNYLVQRYVAFRRESGQQLQRKLFGKYVGFSFLNLALDYAIVGGLNWLGVSPFLGLWISSLFFTFWKYAGYKKWVFKTPS
jgi:putative flippase GtrA